MPEREPKFYPVTHIGIEDVLSVRPDLVSRLQALTDGEMETIANDVGEAMMETYWIALETVLEIRLPKQNKYVVAKEQRRKEE
jgi:hypothetical protein